MNHRFLASAIAAVVLLLPIHAAGQSGAAAVEKAAATLAPKNWTPPRTPDGQPDLQGIWTNATITPLERPEELQGKAFFTAEEVIAYEKEMAKQRNMDRRDGSAVQDVTRAYNDAWWDRGSQAVKTRQTSLIVDPPDGKIPPLTPPAQKKVAAQAQAVKEKCMQPGRHCPLGNAGQQTVADGPEDRPYTERCLVWPTAGPPMLPSAYNNNYQIVQTPGYATILVEMIHDVRIVPLDGRPHMDPGVRQLLGDSRGHWEGNTLVVDTTNFSDETNFRSAGRNLHLTERFTRVAPDTLLYEFTVDDPTTFTKSWTAAIPLAKTDGPIFEYACNEGNYGMTGILSGARAQEAKRAGTPTASSGNR